MRDYERRVCGKRQGEIAPASRRPLASNRPAHDSASRQQQQAQTGCQSVYTRPCIDRTSAPLSPALGPLLPQSRTRPPPPPLPPADDLASCTPSVRVRALHPPVHRQTRISTLPAVLITPTSRAAEEEPAPVTVQEEEVQVSAVGRAYRTQGRVMQLNSRGTRS